RHAALMRHLRKRIGLVHELRKLVRAEECIDHARNRTRIDQIGRSDLLIVNGHTLANRARHSRKTDIELLRKLFADREDAAITEMIEIIELRLANLKFDNIF